MVELSWSGLTRLEGADLGGTAEGTTWQARLRTRDMWEVKLNSAIEALNIAAATEPANKRVIIGNIKKVENVFEKLQRVHIQICQKSKIGLSSEGSREYLRGQVRLKMASVTAAEEALGENSGEAEAKLSLCKLDIELTQLSIDIEGK